MKLQPHVLLLLLLVGYSPAKAQESRKYFFLAPGAQTTLGAGGRTSRAYGAGGGGELILAPHVGIAFEIGTIIPGQAKTSNSIVGIFSANGDYHFRTKTLDPFLTAGYSLMFRDFTANAANFGVGTNYWFGDDIGLLVEARDHYGKVQGVFTHLWEVRVGLTFR
jgi:hypothetical protein